MTFDAITRVNRLARILPAAALAVVVGGFSLAVAPAQAGATTLEDLQQQVSDTNDAYDEACQKADQIQQEIDANEQRIAQIEAELPEKRAAAASCMKIQYKMQQGTNELLSLLFSAEDFSDLVATIQYLDTVTTRSSDAISELVSLDEELEQTRVKLNSEKEQVEQEKQAAADAMSQAVAARQALEAEMAAQAAAEAEEAAAAEAAAAEAVAEGETTFTTATGQEAQIETPSDSGSASTDSGTSSDSGSGSGSTDTSGGSSSGAVEWNEKDAFVSEWTSRINAYLSGSPLAGYGSTFAEAAWSYGCDPRLSPAISCIESGKGTYCFKSHNAWGWGSSSWDSWEEAIWAHTRGLAKYYGGQLSWAGAQMYCPPNASFWYSSVKAQMERI